MPHMPQLRVLVWRSTQALKPPPKSQLVKPLAHMLSQTPATQRCPGSQRFMHAPQLLASPWRLTHSPLHCEKPLPHAHAPAVQTPFGPH